MPKGLYAGYFTGVAGQSMGLFYIGDGIIAGIDVGAMQYDGRYSITTDGALDGVIDYVLPAGIPLITGAPSGATPTRISVKLSLPARFDDGRVTTIETPTGPVNAKFEKLKDLP